MTVERPVPPVPFMGSAEVRARFLNFFREQGHAGIASSSLVPGNDPTLLFTNAGMVQFKDCFLGKDVRSYTRAATSQRCVRAGGKHNDLENVGYTARHHTFFEMLGNFSFGDYFKRDAIHFAWNFLTGTLGLPKARLWVTVYETDDEAFDLWSKEVGVDPARITRMGAKSNFWSMGDTGPCGPCTEIFWDHGEHIFGGPPGTPDEDGDRFVEVWNLVFMQFDRSADGVLTPLPKPAVDTGMGLERISAVMQGVNSNYDIDLFRSLLQAAQRVTGSTDASSPSLRVIADHIRACSFLITDGVQPANEGRGYVLRRIIRRAIRHGYKLGQSKPFFADLVADLDAVMGEAYPELRAARDHVARVLRQEEERFAETLVNGMALLEGAIAAMEGTTIPGETVFKLYDTYGFPMDLTADVARERGLAIDEAGFAAAMEAQRDRARAASKFGVDLRDAVKLEGRVDFCGYEHTAAIGTVVALIRDGAQVQRLEAGESGQVVLDQTPFYAESGGQMGDTGLLLAGAAEFTVNDTVKVGKQHAHVGHLAGGAIEVGARIEAAVDVQRRDATRRNHSATHLLHAALRVVLGAHVQQKGSLVSADRLRFDFSHFQGVSPAELAQIEQWINLEVRTNGAAQTRVMPYEDAITAGAIGLFGEKYESEVRVLSIGERSTELCGGTHVTRTGDIGLFKLLAESGVASGVRRIEAVTGQGALDAVAADEQRLKKVAQLVRGTREDVAEKVEALLERSRRLEKEVEQLKSKLASGQGGDLSAQAVDVAGIKLLAARIDGADAKSLRGVVDGLKAKLGSSVLVLAAVEDGKVALVAGVSADLTGRIKAGDLVGHVAAQIGGKGGGRPDFAQAGGTDPDKLAGALAGVQPWVAAKLGG